MIFGWFGDGRGREVRQLNRDAPEIIEHTYQSFSKERVREVALMTAEHIRRAHTTYGTSEIDLKRAHLDYRNLHKQAQRRRDQVALSAMTLVIIYLRAELVGDDCVPARATIEEFTVEWAPAAAFKEPQSR